jgi:predicted Zn-dependent protease
VFVGTGNQILNDATNDAIQAWNRSGVFHFQTTNDRNKANIVVQAMNNGRTNAAGLTEQSSSPITNRFIHADVYLNQRYLLDPVYGYSHDRIVNTAEHELGHAIGLDHTNLPSVMQPAGSYYPIQSVDVQAVKQLYA